jgi:hypothetical protein
MDNYVVQRIVELQRAIEKLKVSIALTKPSEYTIDWIRDNLEADASFYAWIVTSLEADVSFYNWFRDALEADASFISSLVTSFTGNLSFTNWITNTATYSSESFITLTRTATQTFTGSVQTNITWQAITRNSNNGTQFQTPFVFTPPSATITIPQSGYYTIAFTGVADVVSTKRFFLAVNGNPFVINTNDNQASSARMYSLITNYFDTGDTFQLSMTSSATVIMQVNAEKATNQSPILHVVRVNAAG